MMAALGAGVQVLGLGEALHGSYDLLAFRNRLFQRLVAAHGFSAIALESSYLRGRLVNDHVLGRGPATYAEVQDAGFSHNFGAQPGNRELVEWMRQYNAQAAHPVPLHIYGFDTPTELSGPESPRQALEAALGHLADLDPAAAQSYRERLDPLLGDDAAWQNPAAMLDPAQSIGLSPAAQALRTETEDLLAELRRRRPALAAAGGRERLLDALQCAAVARDLLTYHAAYAHPTPDRVAHLLALRDAAMADTVAHSLARERDRGKVLVFAHNSHLQRGQARWETGWPSGPQLLTWWPAGAHLAAMFGAHYAVIGTAIGAAPAHDLEPPAAGTLEAALSALPGPARLVPAAACPPQSAPPIRTHSAQRHSYFPLTAQSLTDFDWLAALDLSA
jgi:erythromycin esterase-like protein